MDIDITSSTSTDSDTQKPSSTLTILKTPDQQASSVYGYRQNQVSNVMLTGVPIVSLFIDGKERLCLAQISNTLLKKFSYNEIHNRRVALGITCVQCTPVQLEILRRAGAMPISSRRCGMITKREAERLVKSFIEDNRPPKLPENFYFEVQHKCGWGCTGKFEPSRYNSSRAKCIKCSFCNIFFSPNKFIFHFHRSPESKYNHPDAANFNSWRRHLHILSDTDTEDIRNAWEDVKAMFNGGSRKRIVYSPVFTDSHSGSPSLDNKRQKLVEESNTVTQPKFGTQFQNFTMFPIIGQPYPYHSLTTTAPLALSFHTGKNEVSEQIRSSQIFPFNPWRQQTEFTMPPYDMLWASQFGSGSDGFTRFRQNYFSSLPSKDMSPFHSRFSSSEVQNSFTYSSDDEDSRSPLNRSSESFNSTNNRTSAFRPVLKSNVPNNDTNSHHESDSVDEMNEDLDIEIADECIENDENVNTNVVTVSEVTEIRLYSPDTSSSTNMAHKENNTQSHAGHDKHVTRNIDEQCNCDVDVRKDLDHDTEERIEDSECDDINSSSSSQINLQDLSNLTNEELQRSLRQEIDARKQIECDINKLEKSLHDQVKKEKSQRLDIVKKLQAMKDSLCNELERERMIRFSMQRKLKEAYDSLQNFSCKMFRKEPCDGCTVRNPKSK